jgi:hypothetical protein
VFERDEIYVVFCASKCHFEENWSVTMSKQSLAVAVISEIPAAVQEQWGEPPVLTSEDPNVYTKLALQIANAVGPDDVIQWFLIKDVLDLTWEILRLHRIKRDLIELSRKQVRDRAFEESEYKGDKQTPALKALFKTGEVTARAFLHALPHYERIDTLLAAAEGRRAAALREIDRRRDGIASRLRRASDDIIDGEFTEHPHPAGASRKLKPDRLITGTANENAKPTAA